MTKEERKKNLQIVLDNLHIELLESSKNARFTNHEVSAENSSLISYRDPYCILTAIEKTERMIFGGSY